MSVVASSAERTVLIKPIYRRRSLMLYSNAQSKTQSPFTILDGLKLLCEPGEIYELRCPKTKNDGTVSGYFDDLTKLAHHAEFWSGVAPSVYLTLNPVKRDLLARAANRIERRSRTTTADHEVARRCRLLLDFDPVRPPGVSSTEEEHTAALERAEQCKNWLAAKGLPDPLLADSGNGGHLVYGLDLPNDDPSRLLVENFLKTVATRFSDSKVKIDLSVFNAARISKVYGTMACKGDDVPDRPHRLSRILEAPSSLSPVPPEVLAAIGNPDAVIIPFTGGLDWRALRSEARRLDGGGQQDISGWVEDFLNRHEIGVQQTKEGNGKWRRRWVLERCPFCGSEDTAAALTISEDGKIGFRCQHDRCSEPRKRWSDFRRHFEPSYRKQNGDEAKSSRLARLMEHVALSCELISDDASEEALARIPGQGWRPVESKAFRHWLVESFRQATGQAVRSGDLSDALLNIAASCQDRRKTYHRVAAQDGSIYLDLCRPDGKAIHVTAQGWKVIDNPPVVFLTKKDMAPLPIPQQGGSIEELRKFVNVTEEDFSLYLGWLLDALKGRKPFVTLVVNGEQGSGKSTFSVLSSDLIDPCKEAKTKNLPKDVRDLSVLASNRHLLAFDNISWLSEEMSDALCRLATGSGMVLRSLYSNADEQVFGGARPILLNGIPEIGDRSDFLGRTVKITLRAIPEDKRQDEKALLTRFEARRPFLLGALLSLLANGLQHEGKVSAGNMPRMADTYLWLLACEDGTGLSLAKPFEENLRENIKGLALETMLGRALVDFMKVSTRDYLWQGPANHLYDGLRVYWDSACGGSQKEIAKYPGNARVLSGRLTEMMASLRENGIVIEKQRTAAGRAISIDAREHFRRPLAGAA
jgi:hypothetical protein